MRQFYWSKLLWTAAVLGSLSCQNVTRAAESTDSSTVSLVSSELAPAPSAPQAASATCCESACDCCCPSRQWIIGVEALWIAPQLHGTGVSCFNIEDRGNAVLGGVSSSDADLNGFYITPRLTLGVQGECWGIQARYWRMDESRSAADISPLFNTGYIAENTFKAETVDLEVTRLFCYRETEYCASFGVRYAQLQESNCLSANDIVNDEILGGWARSRHNFGGAGLTGALIGKRPVGCKNFNLFYGLRASVVWDNGITNEAESYATSLNANSGAFAVAPGYAQTVANSNMFIGEFQIGGQWDFDLRCVCAKAFVRTAFEYQYWKDTCTGLAASTSSASSDGGQLWSVATAGSTDGHVDLVGLSIATGLTW
jgi:hypothetical protein